MSMMMMMMMIRPGNKGKEEGGMGKCWKSFQGRGTAKRRRAIRM
jgi:hypothetical protein